MKSNFKKAFTLTELIITMVVLGVIAAIVMPTLISKTTEKSKQTKIRKAMASYESTIRNMVVEQQLKTMEELTDLNDEGCAVKVKYFKTIAEEDCVFKTADGLWWDVTYIENPMVAFKKENLSVETANNISNYDAFYFATSYNDDKGKFIVDDLKFESGLNKNFMTKLYAFLGEIEGCKDLDDCYLSGQTDSSTECNDKTGKCSCYEKANDDYWAPVNVYDSACRAVQENYYCDENGTNCEQQCFTEEIPALAYQCAYCWNENCDSYDYGQCSDDCYCDSYGSGKNAAEAVMNRQVQHASCSNMCITSPSSGAQICDPNSYGDCSNAEKTDCYIYNGNFCETIERCGTSSQICYSDCYSDSCSYTSGSYPSEDCTKTCGSGNYGGDPICVPNDLGIDPQDCYSYGSNEFYCHYYPDDMDDYDYGECYYEEYGSSVYNNCWGNRTYSPSENVTVEEECYGSPGNMSCYTMRETTTTDYGSYQCFEDKSYCYIYVNGRNDFDVEDCNWDTLKCSTCRWGDCNKYKKTDDQGNTYYDLKNML